MIPHAPRMTFDPDPLPLPPSPVTHPWKRILVAIDRPDHPALQEAIPLAHFLHASLTLLNVIAVSANATYCEGYVKSVDPLDPMRQRAADILTAAAARIPDDILLECVVREGDVTREILRAIHASHADVLFLGTRRRLSLRRFFFGSPTDRLLARAPCPVVVATAPKRPRAPALLHHRILLHTN